MNSNRAIIFSLLHFFCFSTQASPREYLAARLPVETQQILSQLSEKEMRSFAPTDDVITFPPKETLSVPAQSLSDTLLTVCVKKLKSQDKIFRPIDPPEHDDLDPGNKFTAYRNCLGLPTVRCGLTFDDRHLFWRSLFRPMLSLEGDYQQERKHFALAKDDCIGLMPSPSSPTLLDPKLSEKWPAFQKIGVSIGKIMGLKEAGSATGVYLGERRFLTAGHVVEWIVFGSSTVSWPSLAGAKPDSTIVKLLAFDLERDLAVLEITGDPVTGLLNNITDSPTRKAMHQIAILGYPPRYGRMQPCVANVVMGRFGNLRLSPGVICQSSNPDRVGHDCATENGSSGSPVFDLDNLELIGIQTSVGTLDLSETVTVNLFTPIDRSVLQTLSTVPLAQ